jgi:hypothetical protein
MFKYQPRHVFAARRSSEGAKKGVVAVIGGKQPICIDMDILLGFYLFLFLGPGNYAGFEALDDAVCTVWWMLGFGAVAVRVLLDVLLCSLKSAVYWQWYSAG